MMKILFDHIKQVIALIIVICTYAIFLMVLLKYKTDNNAVSQVIIAAVSGFSAATGYYFGYSQGASKKDETINNISNQDETKK